MSTPFGSAGCENPFLLRRLCPLDAGSQLSGGARPTHALRRAAEVCRELLRRQQQGTGSATACTRAASASSAMRRQQQYLQSTTQLPGTAAFAAYVGMHDSAHRPPCRTLRYMQTSRNWVQKAGGGGEGGGRGWGKKGDRNLSILLAAVAAALAAFASARLALSSAVAAALAAFASARLSLSSSDSPLRP